MTYPPPGNQSDPYQPGQPYDPQQSGPPAYGPPVSGSPAPGQQIPEPAQQTAAALAAHQKSEIEKWHPLIKEAGIKVE